MVTHKMFLGVILVLSVFAGAIFAQATQGVSSGVDSEMKYFSYETQILSVVTGTPQTAYYSGLNLTITNNLPVNITNVEVSYTISGQLTTQKIAAINANSETSLVVVSSQAASALPQDVEKKAQDEYSVKFDPVPVMLTATGDVKVGQEITLKLTAGGNPAPGVTIYAASPNGTANLMTDSNGEAKLAPSKAGVYTYDVPTGLSLLQKPSTTVSAAAEANGGTGANIETPTAAAAVANKEEESTVNSILEKFTMVVIGLVVVAILLLGVVTFYSQRGSRDDAEPPADDYEYSPKEDDKGDEIMHTVPTKVAEEKKETREIVPIPPVDVPSNPTEPDAVIAIPEKEEETVVSDTGSKFPALERLKQRVAQKERGLEVFETPAKPKEKKAATKTWKNVAKNVKFSQKASKVKGKAKKR